MNFISLKCFIFLQFIRTLGVTLMQPFSLNGNETINRLHFLHLVKLFKTLISSNSMDIFDHFVVSMYTISVTYVSLPAHVWFKGISNSIPETYFIEEYIGGSGLDCLTKSISHKFFYHKIFIVGLFKKKRKKLF